MAKTAIKSASTVEEDAQRDDASARRKERLSWDQFFRRIALAVFEIVLTLEVEGWPRLLVIDGTVVSPRGKEHQTLFRQQHGRDCPIDDYRERGTITERQFQAGDRLWWNLYHAGLAPKVTANLLGMGGSGECTYGMAVTERQADARKAVREARCAVGSRLWSVLSLVVWGEFAASAWAQSSGGVKDDRDARTAGMLALRLALDTLADHWGLPVCS